MDPTSLRERHGLSARALADLLGLLGLEAVDRQRLPRLRRLIEPALDEVVEEFYAHLDAHPQLRRFTAGAGARERLAGTLRAYLLSLDEDPASLLRAEERLRIGVRHEALGIEPRWYLGAHGVLFAGLARQIAAAEPEIPAEDLAARLSTLAKVLLLDAVLAVQTYHEAATERMQAVLHDLLRARRELQRMALDDPLTGLPNRRHLIGCLEVELERSRRFGHPFSLLMLDVDRFKKVNDREGHLVGDAVLRQVAQRLQLALRPSDVVGRYGGEEFVVGLVEADAAAALAVAERIRRRVGEEPCGVAGSGVSVTVSLGVAERAAGEEDLTALLSRADAALYRAKRGGRDRVSVAATPAGAPARDPRRSGSSAHGGAHPAGGD